MTSTTPDLLPTETPREERDSSRPAGGLPRLAVATAALVLGTAVVGAVLGAAVGRPRTGLETLLPLLLPVSALLLWLLDRATRTVRLRTAALAHVLGGALAAVALDTLYLALLVGGRTVPMVLWPYLGWSALRGALLYLLAFAVAERWGHRRAVQISAYAVLVGSLVIHQLAVAAMLAAA